MGMIIIPENNLTIDCYVSADFAVLYNVEHKQDPTSVKSRPDHLIMFMGCPLIWSSKLHTQIYWIITEAEFIMLPTSMRDLIEIREILKEIINIFLVKNNKKLESYL